MSSAPPFASGSLTLVAVRDGVMRVQRADGLMVGNLKRVGLVWKFKALGFDEQGALVPGGGPFTDHHNTEFAEPDAQQVNRCLLPPSGARHAT